MNAIGSLMEEHQVIGNTLHLFETEIKKIKDKHQIDPISIDISIDFIRTYTDLVHHGKEENILFLELGKKHMLPADQRIINELMEEHKYSRSIMSRWAEANERYFQGEDTSPEIIDYLTELTIFYPKHIKKENKYFFDIFLHYFRREEQEILKQEFGEFDRNILHWKYRKVETALKERLKIDDQREAGSSST
jgi:hemerythrin-like domain-containing protein